MDLWNTILDFFGHDEFNVRVWGTFFISFIAYWSIGIFYTYVDVTGSPKFILKYKIQDIKAYPISKAQLWDLLKVLAQNQLMAIPLLYLTFYNDKRNGFVLETELPSIWTCVRDFLVFVGVREITFYYSHRLLHHPYFYKRIHKKHHTWISPIAIAAAYCHPIEHILSNVLPIAIGPAIMKSHTILLWIWICYATFETLTVHSGFHLPLLKSSEFHDYHHLKFNYNYGVLGVLDYIHGTDSMFRKSKEFIRHKRLYTTTPVKVLIP